MKFCDLIIGNILDFSIIVLNALENYQKLSKSVKLTMYATFKKSILAI